MPPTFLRPTYPLSTPTVCRLQLLPSYVHRCCPSVPSPVSHPSSADNPTDTQAIPHTSPHLLFPLVCSSTHAAVFPDRHLMLSAVRLWRGKVLFCPPTPAFFSRSFYRIRFICLTLSSIFLHGGRKCYMKACLIYLAYWIFISVY